MRNQLLILMVFVALLASCKKKKTNIPNDGIYRGSFRSFDANGDTLAEGVVYLAMFDADQHFQMVGDSNSMAPASHSGYFVVNGATTIQFENTSAYSSLYHPKHYLDTTYNYKFDNTNYELWQTREGILYKYIMKRD